MTLRLLILGGAALLAGCLSASEPLQIQWYSMEAFRSPPRVLDAESEAAPEPVAFRSPRVTAAGSVQERFATHEPGGRVRYSESLRWVEGPEAVLERRLEARLLRDPRLALENSNVAVGLGVELSECCERWIDRRREARVVVRVRSDAFGTPTVVRRYEGSRAIEAAGPEALAEALSDELDAVIESIVADLLPEADA